MSDRPIDNRPERDGMMDALVRITAELEAEHDAAEAST